MAQFTTYSLESNKRIKFDFGGGELSSDSGLLLLKEFVAKIGLLSYIEKIYTNFSNQKWLFVKNVQIDHLLAQFEFPIIFSNCRMEIFKSVLQVNG